MLYCLIQQLFAAERAVLEPCCRAARCCSHDLPEELQGCCTRFLDTPSAGCFGQANRACWRVIERQLAEAKAALAAACETLSRQEGEAA